MPDAANSKDKAATPYEYCCFSSAERQGVKPGP